MNILERLPQESARDFAFRVLKENIVSVTLKPGTLVSENEIAMELGVSRTPVREAILDMAKVGIIETLPQRGSYVALIDPKMVDESRFLRQVLDSAVIEVACDTSQKIPIRFGETIKAYRALHSASELVLIPLVLAAWLRYLKGIDDNGNKFELSPDPLLGVVCNMDAKEVLHMREIFAVDLFEDDLGDRILSIYNELCGGNGAVREVLHKYVH